MYPFFTTQQMCLECSIKYTAVAYLNTKCCRKNITIISKGLKFDGLDLNCCFTVNYDPFAH